MRHLASRYISYWPLLFLLGSCDLIIDRHREKLKKKLQAIEAKQDSLENADGTRDTATMFVFHNDTLNSMAIAVNDSSQRLYDLISALKTDLIQMAPIDTVQEDREAYYRYFVADAIPRFGNLNDRFISHARLLNRICPQANIEVIALYKALKLQRKPEDEFRNAPFVYYMAILSETQALVKKRETLVLTTLQRHITPKEQP